MKLQTFKATATLLKGDCNFSKKRLQHRFFPVNIATLLTLFRMSIEHFWGRSRMGGGGQKATLPKICDTNAPIMKHGTVIPYLEKIQKIYESLDTPSEFC